MFDCGTKLLPLPKLSSIGEIKPVVLEKAEYHQLKIEYHQLSLLIAFLTFSISEACNETKNYTRSLRNVFNNLEIVDLGLGFDGRNRARSNR